MRLEGPAAATAALDALPAGLRARRSTGGDGFADVAAVLFEGDGDGLIRLNREVAATEGAVVPVYGASADGLASGRESFPLDRLLEEIVVSTNTAAAGGNASLMTIG
ncbi:MAG: hypothetical protein INR64_16660 [Caulobacteraceae bacterium]|nr:hypothetical protein [Caulobacter sp.]